MVGPLAACDACGPVSGTASCKAAFVTAPDDQHVRRIPFGAEQHLLVVDPVLGDLAPGCPACRVPRGGFHHARCRLEECPTCSGSAWNCRCLLDRILVL